MKEKKQADGNRTEKRHQTLTERLDIPAGPGYAGEWIEILGDREIWVTGCRGVLEYEENRVVLKMHRRTLKISGSRLNCLTYRDKTVEIRGQIESLLFGADAHLKEEKS